MIRGRAPLAKLFPVPCVFLGMMRIGEAVLIGLLAACGGRDPGAGLTGLTGPTEHSSCETNPYGACYPTANIGTSAMKTANGKVTPGDHIPNFRFIGFRPLAPGAVDDTTVPATLSLSNYYDPAAKLGVSLLVILVNTEWCGPSNEEADAVAGGNYTGDNTEHTSLASELAPLGVRFLEVLVDGPLTGQPATLDDLREWVTRHAVDYPLGLDGDYAELGQLFAMPAIPFNLVIDARSMEILETWTGFDGSAQMSAHLQNWLAWQAANPPM